MLKILLKSATTLLLFTSLSAKALPIVEADAFTAGDNKAVLELSTGLTWLDFGITNSKELDSVLNELNTTYKGWRLPTESEVIHLWTDLFGSTSKYCDSQCYADEANLISLIGFNFGNSNNPLSVGWFLNENGERGDAYFLWIDDYNITENQLVHSFAAGVDVDAQPGIDFDFLSTLLVKNIPQQNVPEPSTLFLFGLGLLGLGVRRIRKAA